MSTRRKFLKNQIATTIFGLSAPSLLRGASTTPAGKRKKFFLQINLSSVCGWSTGLLMPNDVGIWPNGAFEDNSTVGSPNANINEHFKLGNLVFHGYSKPLAKHANHLLAGVIDPRSLTHGEAYGVQDNGAMPGGGLQPSWIAGIAAASAKHTGHVGPIDIIGNGGVKTGPTAQNISSVRAGNMTQFIANSSDPSTVPAMAGKKYYTDVHELVQMTGYKPSNLDLGEITGNTSTMKSILADKSALVALFDDIKANQLTHDSMQAYKSSFLGGMPDHAAINVSANLHKSFSLASTLIKSESAFGMRLGIGFDDAHSGGSATTSPRSAAAFYCAIAAFWDWVIANGYQNDVLIAITHEFSRSPHTTRGSEKKTVVTSANPEGIEVTSPGTDHWPVAGVLALSGNLPAASRIGAIPTSSYVAAGTSSLNGLASNTIPAFNSMQFFGTLFMRAFPDVFPDQRSVRHIWPLFTETSVIKSML